MLSLYFKNPQNIAVTAQHCLYLLDLPSYPPRGHLVVETRVLRKTKRKELEIFQLKYS